MVSYGGLRFLEGRWSEGFLVVDREGNATVSPTPKGEVVPSILLPPIIDPHVHTGDTFLRDEFAGMEVGLHEAVGPGGFKHRALRDSHTREIVHSIIEFIEEASRAGVRYAVDFREGGVSGIERLRRAAVRCEAAGMLTRVVPLGRPSNGDLNDVLEWTEGLGLSAVRDVDWDVAQGWADAVHSAGKVLGLHVSEQEREDIDRVLSLEPQLLVHCIECTPDDLVKIAKKDIPVVVCPRSNARFGLDLDMAKMMSAGVKVMVGTDNGMVAHPSPLSEAAFLVEEHGLELDEALGLIENAESLNPTTGIGLGTGPDDVTVVRGRAPEDALLGDVIGVSSDGQFKEMGEDI